MPTVMLLLPGVCLKHSWILAVEHHNYHLGVQFKMSCILAQTKADPIGLPIYENRPFCCSPVGARLLMLCRAIGIIFGDVGTSPLYVFASIFNDPPTHMDVMGTTSMIFWTLTLVALIK